MNDDAVAPVIAIMLILAAVATFFAIFNGVYIPSLKESAEIEHIRNVESSFQQFSSDIEKAVSLQQDNLVLSEPVQLGGGDIFLNTLRSSGSLLVRNEDQPTYYLILDNDIRYGTLVNISYTPIGNFWQDQGYRWQYGYLNVTKYAKKQAPLSYSTMTELSNEFDAGGSLAGFAGSFGSVDYSLNGTLFQNESPTLDNRYVFSPLSRNCSRLILTVVNLSASPDHPYASGNGFGKLELTTNVTSEQFYNVQNIAMFSERSAFGNATVRKWNESLTAVSAVCKSNIQYDDRPAPACDDDLPCSGDWYHTYNLAQQTSPVDVTLNIVSIEIGAY